LLQEDARIIDELIDGFLIGWLRAACEAATDTTAGGWCVSTRAALYTENFIHRL
jgi:hypothetical protein